MDLRRNLPKDGQQMLDRRPNPARARPQRTSCRPQSKQTQTPQDSPFLREWAAATNPSSLCPYLPAPPAGGGGAGRIPRVAWTCEGTYPWMVNRCLKDARTSGETTHKEPHADRSPNKPKARRNPRLLREWTAERTRAHPERPSSPATGPWLRTDSQGRMDLWRSLRKDGERRVSEHAARTPPRDLSMGVVVGIA